MKFGPWSLFVLLTGIAAIALACGSSPQLTSISVNPLAADAKDYPDGKVQFKAFGYYGDSTSQVTLNPEWSACPPVNGVTISQTGVAQCNAGASRSYTGPYIIQAFVPVKSIPACNLNLQACGQSGPTCGGVQGVATITCP